MQNLKDQLNLLCRTSSNAARQLERDNDNRTRADGHIQDVFVSHTAGGTFANSAQFLRYNQFLVSAQAEYLLTPQAPSFLRFFAHMKHTPGQANSSK
jgi:hypothetical protein